MMTVCCFLGAFMRRRHLQIQAEAIEKRERVMRQNGGIWPATYL